MTAGRFREFIKEKGASMQSTDQRSQAAWLGHHRKAVRARKGGQTQAADDMAAILTRQLSLAQMLARMIVFSGIFDKS
jgi:hypothetical protein